MYNSWYGRRSKGDRDAHARRFLFTIRQNIQHSQTLMVLRGHAFGLICEIIGHMRGSRLLNYSWRRMSDEVDAGPLAVNQKSLSIEVFASKCTGSHHRNQENT